MHTTPPFIQRIHTFLISILAILMYRKRSQVETSKKQSPKSRIILSHKTSILYLILLHRFSMLSSSKITKILYHA